MPAVLSIISLAVSSFICLAMAQDSSARWRQRSRSSRCEATFMEATSSKRGLLFCQLENEKKMREPPAAGKWQGPPRGGYIRLRAARNLRRTALSLTRALCSFRNGAKREKRGRQKSHGQPRVERYPIRGIKG